MTVKYAGQLSALDLGHEIRFVKKYRYGGEDREKVIAMPIVVRVRHEYDVRPQRHPVTTVTYRRSNYDSLQWADLSPLTEVEVVDAD